MIFTNVCVGWPSGRGRFGCSPGIGFRSLPGASPGAYASGGGGRACKEASQTIQSTFKASGRMWPMWCPQTFHWQKHIMWLRSETVGGEVFSVFSEAMARRGRRKNSEQVIPPDPVLHFLLNSSLPPSMEAVIGSLVAAPVPSPAQVPRFSVGWALFNSLGFPFQGG